jgi:D-tyrosyl-tRNA(Tyr) deacylase
MVAVIQRVAQASVTVENQCIANIAQGLLVLLGVAKGDTNSDVGFMVEKIPQLRIFGDTQGHMNQSLQDINGELLLVSQFTLLANLAKGRRPSFDAAAPPDEARRLYEMTLEQFRALGLAVQGGRFGASMNVGLKNDGPVTLILDSRAKEKTEIFKGLDP